MLAPQLVQVRSVGEDVVLAIGSWRRRMHFETALLLAAWLDECARDAKLWAEDSRRLLRGVGTLHDASDARWLNAGQPNDPRHVPRVNRDLLKRQEIAVRQDGASVVFTAGAAQAVLPHSAAIEIAQWVRVKAKESQLRAGDGRRHWSAVLREHLARFGPGVTRG